MPTTIVLTNPVKYQPATLTLGETIPQLGSVTATSDAGSVGISVSFSIDISGVTSNTAVDVTPIGYFSALKTSATESIGADIYWGFVTLLIHADDSDKYYLPEINPSRNLYFSDAANTSTSNLLFSGIPKIIDSSTYNRSITAVGDAFITPNDYKFGTYSMYFDGIGDKLTFPAATLSADTIFTIECWIKPSDVTTKQILFASANTQIYIQNSRIFVDNITASGATLLVNQWNHIAVVRTGNNLRCYINGYGSTFGSELTPNRTITEIGSYSNADYYTGYMDEVRITSGAARYYTDYTVPTGKFPEGYIDGGATQINSFVGNVVYAVITGQPITGVSAYGSVSGNYSTGLVLSLSGNATQVQQGIYALQSDGSAVLGTNVASVILGSITVTQTVQRTISSRDYPTVLDLFASTAGQDSYYSPVRLQLSGNVANGVNDSSYFPATVSSNSASLSTTTKKFGDQSIYFNGTSGAITYTDSQGRNPNPGSDNFTIEAWINLETLSGSFGTIFNTYVDNQYCRHGGLGGLGAGMGGWGSAGDYNNGGMAPLPGEAPLSIYPGYLHRIGGTGGAPNSTGYGGGAGGGGGAGYYGGGGGAGGGGWWGNGAGGGGGGSSFVNKSLCASPVLYDGDVVFTNYDGISRIGSTTAGIKITNITTSSLVVNLTGSNSSYTCLAGNSYLIECWGSKGSDAQQGGSGYVTGTGGQGGYAAGVYTPVTDTSVTLIANIPAVAAGGTTDYNVGGAGGKCAYAAVGSNLLVIAGGGGGGGNRGSYNYNTQYGYPGGPAGKTASGGFTPRYGFMFGVRKDLGSLQVYGGATDGTCFDISESVYSTPMVAGQWYHVALVRKNNILSMYRDGVRVGSIDIGTKSITAAQTTSYVGFKPENKAPQYYDYFNGYIDDLRYTVGVAQYDPTASSITKPATEFAKINSGMLGDTYYDSTVLLLSADNQTINSTTLVDWSKNQKVITSDGAYISSTKYVGGTSSIYFDGTKRLYTPTSADFNFGSGDFTIEAWINLDNVTGTKVIVDRGQYSNYTPWGLVIGNDQVVFQGTSTGSSHLWAISSAAGSLVAGNWYHVAGVRSGTNVYLFLNGTLVNSATVGTASLQVVTDNVTIGRTNNSFYYFKGYIDSVRITKGVARYTSNFSTSTNLPVQLLGTTSTDEYIANVSLLINTSKPNGTTTFTDSSINNLTITNNGSVVYSNTQTFNGNNTIYLDGSNNLTIADNDLLEFGSGDYTVECSIYPSSSNDGGLIMKGYYLSNGQWVNQGYGIRRFSSGFYRFYFNTSANYPTEQTVDVNIGSSDMSKWTHLAMVVKSGIGYAYVDGVLYGTLNGILPLVNDPGPVFIGKFQYDPVNLSYMGSMTNIRITKGVARYFDRFINSNVGSQNPTVTITLQSNTSTGQVGIVDYISNLGLQPVITSVGTITASQAVTKAINSNFDLQLAEFGDTVGTDPLFNKVVALLHFNGTGTTITEVTGKTVTQINSVTQTGSTPKFGTSAGLYSASSIKISDSTNTNTFISDDFTVEAQVSLSQHAEYGMSAIVSREMANDTGLAYSEWRLAIYTPNSGTNVYLNIRIIVNGTAYEYNSPSIVGFAFNKYYHIAMVRAGTSFTGYIDGVQCISATIPSNSIVKRTVPLLIGGCYNVAQGGESGPVRYRPYGNIDEVRVSSVARYPSNRLAINGFASVGRNISISGNEAALQQGSITAALTDNFVGKVTSTGQVGLINTSQSVNIDINSNSVGGDGYFNNVALLMTDYATELTGKTVTQIGTLLTPTISKYGNSSIRTSTSSGFRLPYSSVFDLASGDHTIELWFNANTLADAHLISKDTYGTNFDWSILILPGTNKLAWYTNKVNSNLQVTIPPLVANTWYHVAYVRYNGTNTIYLNGVAYGSNTMMITNDSQSFITIGYASWNNPNSWFDGHLDDIRITNGVARYTANFTPAKHPTYLATNVTSGAIIGYIKNIGPGNMFDIVPNAAVASVGTVTTAITANYLSKVTATGTAGSMTANTVVSKSLTGNQAISVISDLNASFTTGISGNVTQVQQGFINAAITDNYAGQAVATGQVGTLFAKQTVTFGISSNVSQGQLGNLDGSLAIFPTNNVSQGQLGSISASITDNFVSKVSSTSYVGTVKSGQSITFGITANTITGYAGNTVQNFFTPQIGNSADVFSGNVTAALTATYAAPVTASGQAGTITTSNTQFKALNSSGFRALTTGYVGSIGTTQTIELTGTEASMQIGTAVDSLTESYLWSYSIAGSAGNLGLINDGTVTLYGNQARSYVDSVQPTKFAAITGFQINTGIGSVTAKRSFGVKLDTAVGSVTTSSESYFGLSGVQSTCVVDQVRNYKYSQLIGEVAQVHQGTFLDVAHSFGLVSNTGVGTMTASAVSVRNLSGVTATEGTGLVFASQTIEINGVSCTGSAYNFADVQHSLGVISYHYTGTVKVIRQYDISGNKATANVGTIGTKQTISRPLTRVSSTGKLYEEMTPYLNKIGTHREVDLPLVYQIKVQGEFSYITYFECVNSDSDLIELYFNQNIAWVKLKTPGSFQNQEISYTMDDGVVTVVNSLDKVPEGGQIFNIVKKEPITRLDFKLKMIYDDGFGPTEYEKLYVIDLVVDYSSERDQLAEIL